MKFYWKVCHIKLLIFNNDLFCRFNDLKINYIYKMRQMWSRGHKQELPTFYYKSSLSRNQVLLAFRVHCEFHDTIEARFSR
jgi:hypothetical protein